MEYRVIQQDPAEVAAVQGEEGAVCEDPVPLPGDQVEVVLLAGPGRAVWSLAQGPSPPACTTSYGDFIETDLIESF